MNYNINIDNNKVFPKLKIERSLKTVLDSFVEEMGKLPIVLNKDLFYPHMINTYHGIAHTTRVLLATYILGCYVNIAYEERKASCIAAIIHDLGKQSDAEGFEHGYKSMALYKDKIYNLIEDGNLAKRILNAVIYHSIDDDKCPSKVKNDIIWNLLKDADALDRSRFSSKGCDKSYLRLGLYNSRLGQNIIDLSTYLPSWTTNLNWDYPYQELFLVISKYTE